ncbi:7,8-dihydropterin-6-yl-methyl-4-(beta-D-ribofuranosyl)aminobenzene 5'-phosphate synthase [Dethiosulfatibacter aminovorans DSM 17477]|uniref:7,8-dihydropterin-6-yl-methyl-4-(Beta-D-ribofuranosyl)aminobenzene 5'-phosphate synthase n=1 Tax=Dethiosulfatibacter aminovorans DSM 17477 TaxID=1121476 RepID=A0A1M6ECB7_9FIRM|nr:MBL fold metallo-hydrolase [Dethiosulfatibacter aminovorans]SHI83122.1 7,8-dihydropterin-6-yl-methyl-4-(beta-D-ribofuranosyl)aminobenzene 5'-phosphate synthase [Dethiosulfatibacter aminovorans DSM 17477]
MKITTIIENSKPVDSNLECEHGLSFFVEYDGKKIIFDTGKDGNNFLENAEKLGLDIKNADYMVLSHGHYDHTGGVIPYVDTFGNDFKLIINPSVFYPRYKYNGVKKVDIGMPFGREDLEKRNVNTIFSEDIETISENIDVISGFSLHPEYRMEDSGLFCQENGVEKKDFMPGESVLVMKYEKGLVLLIGCSHSGVVSIIEKVKKLYDEKIYAVFGGTHLGVASSAFIDKTVQYFKNSDIEKIGVCHCNGEKAGYKFKEEIPDRYFQITTGKVIEI